MNDSRDVTEGSLITFTCPICSADVVDKIGRRGRARIYCSTACNKQACRNRTSAAKQAKRRAAPAPCVTCGEAIAVANLGPIPKFCSEQCRLIDAGIATSYPERTCDLDGCEVRFVPTYRNQKCCSERHGKRHYNRRARATKRSA